jgi:hypothetical protein
MLAALEVLGLVYVGTGVYCTIGLLGHCIADRLDRRVTAGHRGSRA